MVELKRRTKKKRVEVQVEDKEKKTVLASPLAPTAMTTDLETGWTIIQRGITKLQNLMEGIPEQQLHGHEWVVLYTTTYNLCLQRHPNIYSRHIPNSYSQQLYDGCRKSLEDYVNFKVLPALGEKHEEFMLKELVKRWKNHKVMLRWMSHFFYYLNRFHVRQVNLPTLSEVGFMIFHDLVHAKMKVDVKDAVLALVDRERKGEQINWALLKNVKCIFVEIGMGTMDAYETGFETFMLQDAADYYSRKAAAWIVEDSCPDYMVKAEECLMREKERVGHYLHASSEKKLLDVVQHEVLTRYETQLLEKERSGCDALLRDGKVDDLSRMFHLFRNIPKGLEPVARIFKEHVTDEGTALVKQAEDAFNNRMAEKIDVGDGVGEHDFVQKVIELHDKCVGYTSKCFLNHSLFQKALKEAIEVVFNKAGSKTAERLATFCDILMKKGGSAKLSDEAIEDSLEKVVKLLAYVNDKDLFGEFHRKKLARRLLFEKNGNYNHEHNLLTNLKQQCGVQFTSKMEGMVMDITLAHENETQFEEYLMESSRSKLGIDFTVAILSSGYWPSYKSCNLALPSEMVKCMEVFKEFYGMKTKNRKLTWIYSLGSCNVTGRFDVRPVELIVTTYQAAVLLLFNVEEKLSYNDIKSQLNLTDEDVVRLLHSLSCVKFKILKKDPSTKVVGQSDIFEFNKKFTNKMRRIRIPLPPMDEKKKMIEDVVKDRRYAIDALIVRIMKSRKQLNHEQLVMECVEQCRRIFKPDVKLIKKQVEDLITRDFLERNVDNPNMYNYLA